VIDKWIKTGSNKNLTFDLPYDSSGRSDRINWRAEFIRQSDFERYYDAHLIVGGFRPERWSTIRPLIKLMYNDSWQASWSDSYAKQFYSNFKMSKDGFKNKKNKTN